MRKRGLFVAGVGIAIFGISFLIADSIILSDFSGPTGFDINAIFEGMFDEITNEITITPGATERVSYAVKSDDAPLLWAIQIIDYKQGDALEIELFDTYGNTYGEFIQTDEIKFEILESTGEDVLYAEITNSGSNYITMAMMFSEDPENSKMYTDPNSPLNRFIIPLLITGTLFIIGLIILIIGMGILIIDMRRQRSINRFDDWSSGR